jgi:MFS family permease
MDRVGPAVVSVVGMIMLSACFAALGLFTGSLFGFLVLTGLLTATSIGTSPLSYTRVLVEHFHRRRGAALAVAVMGAGVGAILIPCLLVPFVAAHGWRSAYLAVAIVVAIAVIPVAVLVRGAAADTERARLHRAREPVALMSIVRTRVFVLLGTLFFLASLAVFGTTVHFVPMLSDAGLPVAEVGKIGAILGFTILGGRLFTGLLHDRFPAGRVTAALFCLSAAGMLALGLGGVKAALPAAVAIGLGMGAEVDLLAYLIARHFPPGQRNDEEADDGEDDGAADVRGRGLDDLQRCGEKIELVAATDDAQRHHFCGSGFGRGRFSRHGASSLMGWRWVRIETPTRPLGLMVRDARQAALLTIRVEHRADAAMTARLVRVSLSSFRSSMSSSRTNGRSACVSAEIRIAALQPNPPRGPQIIEHSPLCMCIL